MNSVLLGAFALLPAIALMIFIYKKDRVEKEPIWLIILLIGAGMFICLPAIPIEQLLRSIITIINNISGGSDFGYLVAENFIGVALVEEGLKWLAMFIITSKNKNFDSLFDGIVYAVSVSLGFAGLENVLYCVQYGWGTAVLRMVMSVPGHCFFALFMGIFYSYWHIGKVAKKQEAVLMQNGAIAQGTSKVKTGLYAVLSLAVPVAIHGLYDLLASLGTVGFILTVLLICGLYVAFFINVHKMSKKDGPDKVHSLYLLLRLYPGLAQRLKENPSMMNGLQ